MSKSLRILILEDNPADVDLIHFELHEAGFTFNSNVVTTEKEYVHALQEFSPDLILSDYDLPQYNGALALAEAIKRCRDIPFILVTGAVGEDRAVEILTQGAKDYVLKDRLELRLAPAVRRALAETGEHRTRKKAEEALREAYKTLEERVKKRTAELEAEIAERKKTEEALRASEERWQFALEGAGDGLWDWDAVTNRVHFSKQWKAMLGYAEDDIGDTLDEWDSRVHPEDKAAVYAELERHFRRETEVYQNEHRLQCKDGSYQWVLDRGKVIEWTADGKPRRVIGTHTDITERKRAEEVRRMLAVRNDAILASVPDIIMEVDDCKRYVWANQAGLRFFGEDVVGREASDYFAGGQEIYHEIQPLFDGSEDVIYIESWQRRQDGEKRLLSWWCKVLKDENKRVIGAISTARDITEGKREEEEMRRSRETAERLAEEMAIIAEIGRTVGSTLDINQVYERVATEVRKLIPYDRLMVTLNETGENEFVVVYASGIDDPGRRLGNSYPSKGTVTDIVMITRKGVLIQPEDAEEIKDRYPGLHEAFKMSLRSALSVPLIFMDEVIGCLSFRSKKLKAYTEQDLHLAEKIGAQIAGAIVNAQLFNDLHETEKSLRESEELFRTSMERAPDGVYMSDLEGNFLYGNYKAEEIIGCTRDELIGRNFLNLNIIGEDSLKRAAELLQANKEGKSTGPDVLEIVRKDGRHILIEIDTAVVQRSGQQIVLAFVNDITERSQAGEKKKDLEERLQRAEKMEALGQLAGGVAHDLNNVLGVSTIYSELLQEKIPEESPLRKYVDNILSSTQKGAAIIEDLLTLARRSVTVSEVMNLNGIVSNFLKSPVFEKIQAYHRNTTFRTECQEELLNIKGSPLHLEKTLMNLVSNAAEAVSGKGEVTIRTENRYLDKPIRGYDEVKEGDYAVLTVSDTGMGIPADNIGKIFEPFYTKKTMGRSGTGLGLAIVWGTVKDHNGYIDLHTAVGEGAAFALYFPVTREEQNNKQQKIPIRRYMGKGESVLVVDDVAEQRDIASTLLTRLGYEVHMVSSGEAAVEYLRGNKADILVLDMIMAPGIDGLETYQRVLAINPQQKAILVSGFSETDRVKEAQKLGAGRYVKKPYLMEKIGVAIHDELLNYNP